MKKTLNEEKQRIQELLKLLDKESPMDNTDDAASKFEQALSEYVQSLKDKGMEIDDINYEISSIISKEMQTQRDTENVDVEDTNEIPGDNIPPENEENIDEYNQKYKANMTQGFAINESNAFIGAAIKAKNEGKDTFQVGGKTYRVTLKNKK